MFSIPSHVSIFSWSCLAVPGLNTLACATPCQQCVHARHQGPGPKSPTPPRPAEGHLRPLSKAPLKLTTPNHLFAFAPPPILFSKSCWVFWLPLFSENPPLPSLISQASSPKPPLSTLARYYYRGEKSLPGSAGASTRTRPRRVGPTGPPAAGPPRESGSI